MKQSGIAPIGRGRKIGVWVCLVAALLLWSPLWVLAWQSDGMSCCENGMCRAHQHLKRSQDRPTSSDSSETHSACKHQGDGSAAPCFMSCGHTEARYFVASVVFLLPQTLVQSRLPRSIVPLNFSSERALLPCITPPDQPPRLIPS